MAFTGEPLAKGTGDLILAPLANGADVQYPGVFEHAQMFGGIVLGYIELFGQVVHAKVCREQ